MLNLKKNNIFAIDLSTPIKIKEKNENLIEKFIIYIL